MEQMNQRIKELIKQADEKFSCEYNGDYTVFNKEKFAELIVRECAGLCSQAAEENARTFYAVTETQEVGPALVAKGSQVQAEKLAKHIREHFGVDENS
jgi:hypothetical protein